MFHSTAGVTNLFETESYFLGTDFAKGYQFDTHFWNSQFAQFTFNYMLLLIINDIHLRQGSPTRCPQVVKCLSTLCHFAVATVAPQMRHTQAPFTVVKKNSTSHSSWKWCFLSFFCHLFGGQSCPHFRCARSLVYTCLYDLHKHYVLVMRTILTFELY